MNEPLKRLNALPASEAEANLLHCCGSRKWAQGVARKRPFENEDGLFEAAERIWWSLPREDWMEAFSRHPKIGESIAAKMESGQSQQWSKQEQAAAAVAQQEVVSELAEANREYAKRFGYVFIVCATRKTGEEVLALLRERLQNDPVAELRVAAEEQRAITRLRLEKFLQSDPHP